MFFGGDLRFSRWERVKICVFIFSSLRMLRETSPERERRGEERRGRSKGKRRRKEKEEAAREMKRPTMTRWIE